MQGKTFTCINNNIDRKYESKNKRTKIAIIIVYNY